MHDRPSQPSEELIDAAVGGSVAALNTLLDRFLPKVHVYVRRQMGEVLRSREQSWDIVQSACREVIRDVVKNPYQSEREFRVWLFKAALRKVQEKGRFYGRIRRDASREQPLDGGGSIDRAWGVYCTFSTPSRIMSAREGVQRIEDAIDALSPDQQEVIQLRLMVGLSHLEIAEETRRSEESVRSLYRRAKVRLAAIL